MACIVNMGSVYHEIFLHAKKLKSCSPAKEWLAKRLLSEVPKRKDWHEQSWLGSTRMWELLDEVCSPDVLAEMQPVKAAVERHVAKAIANGEPLKWFGHAEARREISSVADWLASLPTEDPDMLRKLSKVTWAQAVDHSRRWHERLAKQSAETVAAKELADGTQIVVEAPLADGWRWVRLTTEEALDQEGQAMGHCVGSGGYDSLLDAHHPDGIYSLRDGRGRPHVTVEIRDGGVLEVQGKGNTEPTGHTDKLAMLVRALNVDIDTDTVAPGLFGMAWVDGRLMPIDLALKRLATGPVGGTLNLAGCASLTHLPDGLAVGGTLNLAGCASLTHLPDELAVGGTLNLTGCASLTHLPDGLAVSVTLNLSGCASLTHLPDGLAVSVTLNLSGCTSLTHLPDGLAVSVTLNLSGCTSLTHLPDGLEVGDGLDISGCTSLTHLPDTMNIRGFFLGAEYLHSRGIRRPMVR